MTNFKLLACLAFFAVMSFPTWSFAEITTIAKIMLERDIITADKQKPKYCAGGVFKPCVCAQDVTKRVMYRPAVRECGGKAGILLSGNYSGAFSAVLRNIENADRVPNPAVAVIKGCSRALASSANPPNRCSFFKAQKVIKVEDDNGDATLHCMGTSGNSSYGKTARRITIKLADRPSDSSDPLVRVCLKSPLVNLN